MAGASSSAAPDTRTPPQPESQAEPQPMPAPDALDHLAHLPAEALLGEVLDRYGDRVAIGTSFQHTGLVVLDLVARLGRPFRVFTIDTQRLPPETYRVMEEVQARYGLEIERFVPDPAEVRSMLAQHGEHLFFDSPEKRLHCCRIRKERPNARAIATLDAWVTGLRRDQSADRAVTPKVRVVTKYGRPVLKVSPLADWTEAQVTAYVRAHDLPVNALYAQGYATIGCAVCTSPVLPWEDARAGRWRWERAGTRKECGLHLDDGAGI